MTPSFDILGPGLLLPSIDRAAGRQPAHGRGLPRHVPAAAGLPPAAASVSRSRRLCLADLDAPAVLAFLDHLEAERGNGPRTRNARLAALRSFVQYAASRDPTAWPLARRVLAIPAKRYTRPLLGYLTREEMQAVLDAPDAATWAGQRDRVLFAVMYNTGARVSEVVGLRRGDLTRRQRTDAADPGQGPQGACRAAVEADGRGAGPMVEVGSRPSRTVRSSRTPAASRSAGPGVEDRLALAVEQGHRVMPEPPGQDRSRPIRSATRRRCICCNRGST